MLGSTISTRKFQLHSNALFPCDVTEAPTDAAENARLIQELMAVFGNDSLWQRAQQPPVPRKLGKRQKKATKKPIATPNPISASWKTISSWLPFNNNLDLGSNSESDIYVQFLAKKDWDLTHGFSLDTAQIYRYGSSSKTYTETDVNLTQQLQNKSQLSTQFNISKTQDEEYSWSNRTFKNLTVLSKNDLSYGILSTGNYENKALRLNEWGPYLSWKRPIWRDWLFMQNDLQYLNAPTDKQDNHFGYQLSFEMNF